MINTNGSALDIGNANFLLSGIAIAPPLKEGQHEEFKSRNEIQQDKAITTDASMNTKLAARLGSNNEPPTLEPADERDGSPTPRLQGESFQRRERSTLKKKDRSPNIDEGVQCDDLRESLSAVVVIDPDGKISKRSIVNLHSNLRKFAAAQPDRRIDFTVNPLAEHDFAATAPMGRATTAPTKEDALSFGSGKGLSRILDGGNPVSGDVAISSITGGKNGSAKMNFC